MDALSALKMVVPQLADQSLLSGQEATAAKSISIPDLDQLSPGAASQAAGASQTGGNFQNMLGDFVNEVSAQQSAGSDAVNGLLSGKNVSLHQAMISMEEASVSFQLMVEVRNKLLDSYQELMRMQV